LLFLSFIAFTLGVMEGIFSYISPNLNGSGWNLEYKWGVTVRTHTKIFGGTAPVVSPKDAKMCFVYCHQYNADFRPLILHWFWPFSK